MLASMSIREACRGECGFLSALALRSKAHWGYSREFLDSCRDELGVEASRLCEDDYQCFVADSGAETIGFYALQTLSVGTYELEALFVEPKHIGCGVGRSLLRHATEGLSRLGASRLIIQGDPNASRFYRAAGAVQVGERESGSIPGRFLPLFEIEFATA